MKKILILNGPNLNLLGKREVSIYGTETFEQYFTQLKERFKDTLQLEYFQSNHEGELIDQLHKLGFDETGGIILNAGGFTHTSVAIRDAVAGINTPVTEVHISNIHAREEFRHTSLLTPVCKGIIAGFGLDGYRLALENFVLNS
jgi:3-dehydroquinate dehydratase-2